MFKLKKIILLNLLLFISLLTTSQAAEWQVLPLYGNSVRTFCIDLSNSDTLYLVTDSGSLFRSRNAGRFWEKMVTNYDISCIAVDPLISNIIYAGDSYTWSEEDSLLFKSTDYGKTWRRIDADIAASAVKMIAINYQNSNIVYAATDNGIFKTIDAGESWYRTNTGLTDVDVDIVFTDPVSSNIVYCCTPYNVYKSTDYGESWNLKHTTSSLIPN